MIVGHSRNDERSTFQAPKSGFDRGLIDRTTPLTYHTNSNVKRGYSGPYHAPENRLCGRAATGFVRGTAEVGALPAIRPRLDPRRAPASGSRAASVRRSRAGSASHSAGADTNRAELRSCGHQPASPRSHRRRRRQRRGERQSNLYAAAVSCADHSIFERCPHRLKERLKPNALPSHRLSSDPCCVGFGMIVVAIYACRRPDEPMLRVFLGGAYLVVRWASEPDVR